MFGGLTKTGSMMDLIKLTEKARERAIRVAADREVVLIIGNTGAGKSTFVNYLAGCSMRIIKISSSVTRVVEADDPVVEIGHGRRSSTAHPITFADTETGLTYCDCPGFFDNRGPEFDIRNSFVINHIANSARCIKAVVVIVEHSALETNRAASLQETLSVLNQLFGGEIGAHVPSVHLMVSKAPVDGSNALKLVDLIEFMQEERNPIIDSFIACNHINMYDPLNRGRSLGVLSKQDIIDTLRNSQPIQNAESVIQVSLSPNSITSLDSSLRSVKKSLIEDFDRHDFGRVEKKVTSVDSLRILNIRVISEAYDEIITTLSDKINVLDKLNILQTISATISNPILRGITDEKITTMERQRKEEEARKAAEDRVEALEEQVHDLMSRPTCHCHHSCGDCDSCVLM